MKIYVDGNPVARLPQLAVEEKLRNASAKLTRFWNTPLKGFWQSVYVHYREELYKKRKAGKPAATGVPAPDNHDDNPAA